MIEQKKHYLGNGFEAHLERGAKVITDPTGRRFRLDTKTSAVLLEFLQMTSVEPIDDTTYLEFHANGEIELLDTSGLSETRIEITAGMVFGIVKAFHKHVTEFNIEDLRND